ncbi:MAG: preprotein translocase subunit YajC [Alphaproteobacteria bacterium]|nr:preprotein translocase subunit YajC [Alphaproteobacteria bacterium]
MISFLTLAATATATTQNVAGNVPQTDWARGLIQFVAIIFIFYLFFIRPQQKRAKEQLQMLAGLKVGDEVVVAGIIGKISRIISAGEVEIQIADGVKVKVLRSSVSQVMVEKEDAKPLEKQKKK